MPQLGEKTTDYPLGYGYCQCGCGRRTRLLLKGYMGKFFNGAHARLVANQKHKPEHKKQNATDPIPMPTAARVSEAGFGFEHKAVDVEANRVESATIDRLKRACCLLSDVLRNDSRLFRADLDQAAEIIGRAIRLFGNSESANLSIEDWVIKEGLVLGQTLYDLPARVRSNPSSQSLELILLSRSDLPQPSVVRISPSKLSMLTDGEFVRVDCELQKSHNGTKWHITSEPKAFPGRCARVVPEVETNGQSKCRPNFRFGNTRLLEFGWFRRKQSPANSRLALPPG